jgi:hypothetical protein
MGYRILNRLVKDLAEVSQVDRQPEFEGRLMVMYLAPTAIKPGGQKKPAAPKAESKPEAKAESKPEPKPEKEESNAKAEEQPRSDETVS